MALISKREKEILYKRAKSVLGYPIRTIALLSKGENIFDDLLICKMTLKQINVLRKLKYMLSRKKLNNIYIIL